MKEDIWWSLRYQQKLEEPAFHSNVPVLGPLIAGFRERWNRISTKWYCRPLIEQQSAFNAAVYAQLRELEARLVQQDRDNAAMARDVAEMRALLVRRTVALQELEQRLSSLDSGPRPERDTVHDDPPS